MTWERRTLHLHHPFNISSTQDRQRRTKEVLLVRIEHAGHTGWGEAAPVSYHHQTLDSAEATLAGARELLGSDPFALEATFGAIWDRFPDQPAAIAAIDGALHDLIGKTLGVPVWKLLGLDPSRMPLTSFSIGIDDEKTIALKVREAAEYPLLKVKVGTDRDAAILAAVRGEAPDKPIRVDANGGWTSANVVERCRELAKYRLELIEQPTKPDDLDGLTALRAEGIVPVFADESCTGVSSVLPCAEHFDGINIKLCKCGGIRQGLKMIHIARAAGLKVMLGCMVETSVGISAAAQLAPLADCIDLDGHLLLADDPFEGLGGRGGKLTLNDRPGLGIRET